MLTRPVTTVVDDQPQALVALRDALARRRFVGDYRIRIVSHLSARAALDDLEQIRASGEQMTLVTADQRMPEMTGIERLGRAHEIHAAAQRVLLVEWGDHTAAPTIIRGCTFGHARILVHASNRRVST